MSEAFVVVESPQTDEHEESGVTRRADVLVARSRTSPKGSDSAAIMGRSEAQKLHDSTSTK